MIGIVARIIDVLPMIAQKMNWVANLSAFMQWLALGLVIPYVDWPLVAPWLKGAIIALLFAIPILLIVGAEDKKALMPITIMSLLLGAGVGWAGAVFV
jgi:hypothetical protein